MWEGLNTKVPQEYTESKGFSDYTEHSELSELSEYKDIQNYWGNRELLKTYSWTI